MSTARQFWRASWLGILFIGLGILFYLDNMPNYKGIFFPGLLILIGILLLIGGIIRASARVL
ncbi:MAG: hypothetical protein ACUVT5_04660 [Candidatus Bathyarchaeales archaeon]